jgi:hypothetical protein
MIKKCKTKSTVQEEKSETTIVKKSETKDPCVLLAENDSFLLSPLSFSLILLCI